MPKANNQTEPPPGHFANLKRLAYFAAVVEAGSFTAAAERSGSVALRAVPGRL